MLQRSGRVAAGLCAAATVLAGVHATRAFHASPVITVGSRAPAIDAPLPGVWIFARADCGHCVAHLELLRNVVHAYPESLRLRVARRITVVGDAPPPCDGVRVLPDSLRRALGIRWTPETWFVDAGGRVCKSWRGPRGARVWRSALEEMTQFP